MPLPGVLQGQPNLLNNRQSGNEVPLPGVLPGQPSLLNNSRQSGNGMPLPGKLPSEGLAPNELGSKPSTLWMRWRGWWYTH